MKQQSSLIRYRHRQSGSTAYRMQARPALMGPGLRLTAMLSPNLPFNGRHRRYPCNYMDNYSFTGPGGMESWVGLLTTLDFHVTMHEQDRQGDRAIDAQTPNINKIHQYSKVYI